MTTSKDLLLAILAMDSYSRGYGQGIVGLDDPNAKIGTATFLTQSNIIATSAEVASGFYASAYTLNDGTTVIAYRGTDNTGLTWSDILGGSDPWNGYGTAAGFSMNDQAHMAADFFQAVTGTNTSNPSTGSAILTGHSLGGGLAGFIAAIYRQNA